ncbi:hypothetical protein OBBRIDRAFT_805254 [Obba rivulosa]|uniref:Uncharacterized protein n=1 Tax=Obba rivulosa TaxID=1052685 RepID=A0A8E2APR8_9APHY|nr:hypothetical protein OBBRIDRAFT_805254 [Obba rivulosa]
MHIGAGQRVSSSKLRQRVCSECTGARTAQPAAAQKPPDSGGVLPRPLGQSPLLRYDPALSIRFEIAQTQDNRPPAALNGPPEALPDAPLGRSAMPNKMIGGTEASADVDEHGKAVRCWLLDASSRKATICVGSAIAFSELGYTPAAKIANGQNVGHTSPARPTTVGCLPSRQALLLAVPLETKALHTLRAWEATEPSGKLRSGDAITSNYT